MMEKEKFGEGLYWLLRYGRKNSGPWDDYKNTPDDDDYDLLRNAPLMEEKIKDIKRRLSKELKHLRSVNDESALEITNILADLDNIEAEGSLTSGNSTINNYKQEEK
jgi:hypothetical protein